MAADDKWKRWEDFNRTGRWSQTAGQAARALSAAQAAEAARKAAAEAKAAEEAKAAQAASDDRESMLPGFQDLPKDPPPSNYIINH